MTLFPGIESKFSSRQRQRGLVYAFEGSVRLMECSPDHVRATVRGTSLYSVGIDRVKTGWDLACTCPAFEREFACKHLWAAVQVARRQMGERGTPERERWQELWGGEDDESTLRPPRDDLPAIRPHPSIAATRRASNAWRAQIRDLENANASGAGLRTRIHVRYVLLVDAEPSSIFHQLETQTARESARGKLLAFRPTTIRPSDAASLDATDLRINALLWGGSIGSTHTALFVPSRWTIPVGLQSVLLPLLASSGRLHLSLDGETSAQPLRCDAGDPWVLEVVLRRAGANLVLEGRACRGDERIPLAECDALFEGGIIVARGLVCAIDWRGAWSWAQPLRRYSATRIPAQQISGVLDLLARLPGSPKLEAAEFVTDIGGIPSAVMRLMAGVDRQGRVEAEVLFVYADRRVSRSKTQSFERKDERLIRVVRDHDAERELENIFTAAGGELESRAEQGHDALVPTADVPGLVERLTSAGWTVEAEGQRVRTNSTPSLSVSSGIDWFDVSGHVDFDCEGGEGGAGGARAEMPELLRALRDRDRFVVLSDGSRGLLPETWLASWGLCAAIAEEQGSALRVSKSHAWLLDAWLAEKEGVDVDAEFARVREVLQSGIRPRNRREAETFRGELRAYQREGLGWLHFLSEIGLGGCLADDMGLGKTVQVLALVLERRARARGPTLVVAPRSVLFNWIREAERFTPTLNVKLHHGTARARSTAPLEDADLVVTSYGTLRRDAGLLSKVHFDCAVLDEAQAIKNEVSISAKAARTLQADLRLALTGTPVENHLGELFSIFAFLNPALVQGSRKLKELMSGPKDDVEAARLVARAVRPFLLRRTKEQVLTELPPKTEQIVACEMEGAEKRSYEDLRKHFRETLLAQADKVGIERMQMNVLEALLRLRQAACHPGLIDPTRVGEDSAKLEALLPMLEEVRESGHRALVFSQFTSFLAILRSRLDARGIPYEYLDGKTRDREERVKRFQEDAGVSLFLISLKAGGLGLNLTGADYVFLLDPWWNPAVEQQAIDRTHRIGQIRPVTAYRLVARGTVEEKVLELQERKRALAQALFDTAGATLRDLTREDLEWLLS